MTSFAETKFGRPVSKKLFVRNNESFEEGSGNGNEEAETR